MKEKDSWYRPQYRVRAMKECIRNLLDVAQWCEECIRRECSRAEECKKKLRWIKGVFEDYAEHLGITLLFTIDIEHWRVQPHPKLFEEKAYIMEPTGPKVTRQVGPFLFFWSRELTFFIDKSFVNYYI